MLCLRQIPLTKTYRETTEQVGVVILYTVNVGVVILCIYMWVWLYCTCGCGYTLQVGLMETDHCFKTTCGNTHKIIVEKEVFSLVLYRTSIGFNVYVRIENP